MKYLKLFEEEIWLSDKIINYRKRIDIYIICKQYDIKKYTVNSDGSIDVDNNVYLFDKNLKNLTKLPLKFNKVNGRFDCSYNKLTSLKGSPIEINDSFYCDNNQLTSFEFSPKIIRGNFNCSDNNIKSFEYFPSYVRNEFCCNNNLIWHVWRLFRDTSKIELLNDFDIFRDEDTNKPAIVMDRLNDFLLTIGKDIVKKVEGYKNI